MNMSNGRNESNNDTNRRRNSVDINTRASIEQNADAETNGGNGGNGGNGNNGGDGGNGGNGGAGGTINITQNSTIDIQNQEEL